MAEAVEKQSVQEIVRSRYPDLNPAAGPAAARRWKRLVRFAEVAQEYEAAQAAGEKSPANAIAKARGVEPGTVRTWLHQARQEGFSISRRVACNEMGPVAERVAANVRQIRCIQRLTTGQLAEKVSGLGRPMYATTITKIEKLQRRVDVDDLASLAAALGTTAARLLEPPTECTTCHGTPPPGFACNDCGAGASTLRPSCAA